MLKPSLFMAAAVGLTLITAATAAEEPPTLDQARSGRLACFTPAPKAKTCRSLIAYVFGRDGAVTSQANTVLLPAVIMHRQARITVKDGAVCSRLTAADIDRLTFTMQGAPASAKDTADLRSEMKKVYANLFGHELCTSFYGVGAKSTSAVTLDGVRQKDTDEVLWVGASDGYRVADPANP